mmetsp:Transcript_6180/g.9646  ORF Transcript_6180/g.9646 Transcript_6180/m.9646 type:complete len:250 (+) Transcript_6180:235-984(+)
MSKHPNEIKQYPPKHDRTIRSGRDKVTSKSHSVEPMIHPTPTHPNRIPSFNEVVEGTSSEPRELNDTFKTSVAPYAVAAAPFNKAYAPTKGDSKKANRNPYINMDNSLCVFGCCRGCGGDGNWSIEGLSVSFSSSSANDVCSSRLATKNSCPPLPLPPVVDVLETEDARRRCLCCCLLCGMFVSSSLVAKYEPFTPYSNNTALTKYVKESNIKHPWTPNNATSNPPVELPRAAMRLHVTPLNVVAFCNS